MGVGWALVIAGVIFLLPGQMSAAYGLPCLIAGAAVLFFRRKGARAPEPEAPGRPGPRRVVRLFGDGVGAAALLLAAGIVFDSATRGLFPRLRLEDLLVAGLIGGGGVWAAFRLQRLAREADAERLWSQALDAVLRGCAAVVAVGLAVTIVGGMIQTALSEGPADAETAVVFLAAWPFGGVAAALGGFAWRDRLALFPSTRLVLLAWTVLGGVTVASSLVGAIALAATSTLKPEAAATLLTGAAFAAGAGLIAFANLQAARSAAAALRAAGGVLAWFVAVLGARAFAGLVAYTSDFGQVVEDWRILVLIYPVIFLAAAGAALAVAWFGARTAWRAARSAPQAAA